MWYLHKDVVLTKDNLAKRNWNGGKIFVMQMRLSNICFLIVIMLSYVGLIISGFEHNTSVQRTTFV
jgi:hypothetical protein